MTVRIGTYKNGGFEVDIRLRLVDGTKHRERIKAPVSSKTAALRWGQDREAYILRFGLTEPKKEVPTFKEFSKRFVEEYARAEQQKDSGIESKELILKKHLLPLLGNRPLNEISVEDVQRVKTQLRDFKPKTVNNILSVLGKLLSVAVDWGVIDSRPPVKLLKSSTPEMEFYDFEDYEKLVGGAQSLEQKEWLAVVLLGGDAGLRRGEIIALEQDDVDYKRGYLVIQRNEPRPGKVGTPKSNKSRRVRATARLLAALSGIRHLKGKRVFYREDGSHYSAETVRSAVKAAERAAGMPVSGKVHKLRHTFCSHLAMRGASVVAIKNLAGHADITTTQRYMHLSPASADDAIELLDAGRKADAERGRKAPRGENRGDDRENGSLRVVSG